MAALPDVPGEVADGDLATPAWANAVLQWLREIQENVNGAGFLLIGAGDNDLTHLDPPPSGTNAVLAARGSRVVWDSLESIKHAATKVGQILYCNADESMIALDPPTTQGKHYLEISLTRSGATPTLSWVTRDSLVQTLIPSHASSSRPTGVKTGQIYVDTS